jgi:signal transduction histidine kinase/CheY-like chemotaxis protein
MTIDWLKRIALRIPWPGIVLEYAKLIQPASDLSPEKHVQLLKMTHDRLIYSFTAMPFVSTFAAFFYGTVSDMRLMGLWALGYCIAYFFSAHRQRQFEADEKQMEAKDVFDKWAARLKRVATYHGLALCAPLVLTLHEPNFEFTTLWYLVIGAVVAGNATHQTPVLGIFLRFFNTSWNVATLLSFWAYPDKWHFITPMIFMFTAGIYRHALIAHKFFLQQVRLEEGSTKLAAQFKLAKDAAEDALKAKNRFLATASHDLRQPVHAMSMLIEAISHRNQDATLQPAITDLRSSLHAMNLMFNSLLDLSKLESGVIAVERKSVHLQPLLQEIATLFASEARGRNLELRLRLPRVAAFVYTDPNLLRQVVLNLTQNALRYTPQGGVLLGVRKRGNSWQIEVCDTGIGVAKEKEADIYLPYFRDEHAWGIDSEGHGLGLSVVARCALLMKAPLDMTSRLGRGSRFWITVPSIASTRLQEAADAPDALNNNSTLSPINRGCCLIVEDDPQVNRAWQAMLHAWGVEFQMASNSTEAFACMDSGFIPQVILCDERLRAGESGFELLKALLERLPDAHGAMVSGEFNAPALVQAEDEGYLVLRKPVEVGVVHSLLSRWLS